MAEQHEHDALLSKVQQLREQRRDTGLIEVARERGVHPVTIELR